MYFVYDMDEKFVNDVAAVLNRESLRGELEAWLRQTLTGACSGGFTLEGLDPPRKRLWTDFIDGQMGAESPLAERLLTLVCQKRAREVGGLFSDDPKMFRDFFFQNEQRIS